LQELVEGLLPRLCVEDRRLGQHTVEIEQATADKVGKAQWHSGIMYPFPERPATGPNVPLPGPAEAEPGSGGVLPGYFTL
jgi:hypothetical protein